MHMEPFPSQKGCWNVFLLDSRCSGAAMFEHDLSLEGTTHQLKRTVELAIFGLCDVAGKRNLGGSLGGCER
ncbi:hypothetical protein TWF103_004087 [Orbilia oligospora]|nr:hypothetical protein TWF103_004087 [Orbilia oligospora]